MRELNIICCKVPLVSTTKDKKYGHTQEEVEPGLYVIKHSNNNMKKDFLDTISKAFNLGWTVEVLRYLHFSTHYTISGQALFATLMLRSERLGSSHFGTVAPA